MAVAFGVSLVCTATAAIAATVTTKVTKTYDLVRFSSGVARVENGSDRAFTIHCEARSAAVLTDTAWMDECNRLGREVLHQAVAEHLIDPVSDTPFVAASTLKGMPTVNAMGFTRRIPLAP